MVYGLKGIVESIVWYFVTFNGTRDSSKDAPIKAKFTESNPASYKRKYIGTLRGSCTWLILFARLFKPPLLKPYPRRDSKTVNVSWIQSRVSLVIEDRATTSGSSNVE